MAKFLLVVPPLTGHVNPLLSVAAELESRGHQVAWVGYIEFLQEHLPSSAVCFALPRMNSSHIEERTQQVKGLESIKFFYEEFCLPMAEHCLRPLEQVVQSFNPDVVVCDHQMVAGALIARKHNVLWASSITTSASILKPPDLVSRWLGEKFLHLQKIFDVEDPIDRPDFSPYACIVFSSKELVGDEYEFIPAPYHFVGPSISAHRKPVDFPWSQLDADRKKVLISLGTVSRDRSKRFYEVMIEALAGSELQVIMVAPEEIAKDAPDNFIIQPRVPQLELLHHVDLVVSHAGHNTVCETLGCGKPMVLAPIRDDQPIVARQVVNAGAGLSLRFGKVTANTARKTIETVLNDVAFRHNACRIQQSFRALQGGYQAASILEALLSSSLSAHVG